MCAGSCFPTRPPLYHLDSPYDVLFAECEELNMPIPDPPPDPTYYQILLADPEGSDAVELQRLLEDCGLRVLRVEELSQSDVELRTKKPSEKAVTLQDEGLKAG
jgi:hypothetical protein